MLRFTACPKVLDYGRVVQKLVDADPGLKVN